ncbi:hypothetical protein ANN_01799 [Periplaneta americana]|uniref:Uncharacterized protein n=1 Tax=Periplaneta americana TaxID=6978 RepID=A0ABQ8TWY9_PERAM|nr:hypothetical protein ANN_01799 [Periplaneta americana]
MAPRFTQPPIKLSTGSFPGVKGGQSVVPTTPPHTSAEVMESMGLYLHAPQVPSCYYNDGRGQQRNANSMPYGYKGGCPFKIQLDTHPNISETKGGYQKLDIRPYRKIFGAKRDEVTGEWRKLHNAELRALYSSPDIIRNIKSRRLRWAGHVAHMGESRNANRVLVGRPDGKRPLMGG